MADTSAEEKELYNQSKAFFQKHMPEANDEVLVVLKGHLLLEQAIEKNNCLKNGKSKRNLRIHILTKSSDIKSNNPGKAIKPTQA